MPEKFSVKKRAKSFTYAFKGIKLLMKQHNAWIHLAATIVVIAAGFYLKLSRDSWLAVIIAIGMVWSAEAFNTALEHLVNLVSPEQNETAGKVKDIAAGAVLIAAIAAAIIGCVVFIPEIISLFQ